MAVILVKVWRPRRNGTFAATCIVWLRQPNARIAHYGSVQAHDFGTAQMSTRARQNLLTQLRDENDQHTYPFVPDTMVYTMPTARPAAGRSPQIVEIPAEIFTVEGTNEDALAQVTPAINNLRLDLSRVAQEIENTQPRREQGGVADAGDDEDEEE